MIRSRSVLLLAVLTALGPLAACADDSSPSSGGAADRGPATERDLPTEEATGEPIKLGFVNS